MNIEQKIIALNILRNAGRVVSELGRKAAVLEILGHPMLAQGLIHTGYRIEFEEGEVARLSAGAPDWPYPADYVQPPDLSRAEDMMIELRDRLQRLDARVADVAAKLEAEIEAADPTAIPRWQEGQIP